MNNNLKQQSNPFSTGGGGVNFETRVQAAFAVSLLTRSCVPCMSTDMRAKELKFQNKYEGVNTDDFVLIASDASSNESKLFAQVKHEITISESDDSMFAEVINSAWKDFKNNSFNFKHDSIALITGPLPKLDVNNTLPILEWAKYSSSATEFFKKLETVGFASKAKLQRLNIFRTQLTNANAGKEITDDELWSFLKVFQLISYDLDRKYSVVASLLCSLIQNFSTESPTLVLAKIVTCVQEFNQNAGTLTLGNVPNEVSSLFKLSGGANFNDDIYKLQERGENIFAGIANTISSFHVDRHEQLAEISELYSECNFLFVTGARGTGKSGIVKDFISTKSKDVPVFYLRAEDLDKSHLNDVFTSFGMNSTLGQLEGCFSLLAEKILVIESLEKILELTCGNAFVDLLQYIKRQSGWSIIATGRDYAYQQLVFNYLQPSEIQFGSINIEGFTNDQIEQVCEQVPKLKPLISNSSLVELLRVPFFIEIAARAISNGALFQSGDTEIDFRNTVWATVISKDVDRKAGMPAKRRSTFIEIAKQRAKKMVFGIRDTEFDPEVISKLEEDNLIHRDQRLSLISPIHDVLEDWALEEFIESEYIENSHDLSTFLSTIGNEPAINRAFRLWLYRRLKFDDEINEFIEEILITDSVESYWKDETIAAILQNDSPITFLYTLKSQLLKDDCSLLIRFCFILRITCQRPGLLHNEILTKDETSGLIKFLFLQPHGNGWGALINFIYDFQHDLSNSVFTHIVEVIDEWCGLINIYDDLPKESKKVGLLALWLLESVKNSYQDEGRREKILNVLLKVSPAIETEFDELMSQDVFVSKVTPQRLNYVNELSSLSLVGVNVPMLCKRRPEFVVKLSLHEWLLQHPEEDEYGYRAYPRIEVEESFGLETERDFFPASGAKGPFKYLLQFHPRIALDFIIKLCNLTAQKYAESEFAAPSDNESILPLAHETVVRQIELTLNDGSIVKQYTSPHLWKGYRGLSTLPCVLQCALMGLENWLVEYVSKCDTNNQIEWLFDYLLRSSNSVMPASVLASVAIGFPKKVGKAVYPLLKSSALYHLDLERMTKEMGGNEPNWFASSFNRDVMSKFYVEERREAALKAWRKESLETLITRLQFEEDYKEDVLNIVDELIAEASERNEENLRFMVHRVDTRSWEAIEDKENNRIILQSNSELPEDLKQVQNKFNKKFDHDNVVIRLNLWAKKRFEENILSDEYFVSHIEALDTAESLLIALQNNEIHSFTEMAVSAITTAAAVCIRDELTNLSTDQKKWCFDIILECVCMHADIIEGRTAYDGSGACAFVLSKLFDLDLDEEDIERLKYAIATALTHENVSVSACAAKGVREFLWSIDSELASFCVSGAVEFARFRREDSMAHRFYHLKGDELERALENWNNLITTFRKNLLRGNFKLSANNISLESHSPWFIHIPILLLPFGSNNNEHIQLLKKIVNFVYDSEYHDYRANNDEKFTHEIKTQIQDCLTEHVIYSRSSEFIPFKELLALGCSKAPRFIYSLKLSFDVAMEKEADFDAIWSLWSILATEAHKIALNDVNDRYIGLQNDLNRLLCGILYADCPWQGHENEEKDIKRGARYLLDFAKQSANNSHVFEALASLMYQFHQVFFDKAIHILAAKFSNNPDIIAKQINTAYYLEMSIGRYLQIENRGTLSRKMYNACIELLTGIVETGSARAYYLREHLIRSRKIAV